MSQKPISRKLFLDLATLHFLYVTITPANRCHGKVIMFLNAIFKVCKISKTKRRNTYLTGLVVKLFFDTTLLMTYIIRRLSTTDNTGNKLGNVVTPNLTLKNDLVANMPKIFSQY